MSEFQINYFQEISELFIDGTFKVAPKNWYQLLNIFGYDKNHNIYMPLAFIILNAKSEEIYNEVFEKIIVLVKSHTNLKSFKDIKIMSDFEIGLRRAIKNKFEDCLLDGCYFHYCKAIWKKIKKLNLFKKKLRYNTIIIVFCMKAYPFIKDDKKENFYNKMEVYCNNLGANYIKLINYFNKYWKDCDIFNFSETSNKIIENRTNNICESFHSKLNRKISHFHPKMSYLVNELKILTKEYYDEYICSLSKIKNKKESPNYIAKDIFEFIKKFVNVSKENFDLDSLIQNVGNDGNNFYNLIIEIMEKVSDESENVIESLKSIFIKNNILKSNEIKKEENEDIEKGEEEEEDEEDEKNIEIEKENIDVEDKNIKIKKDPDTKYLINGDVIIYEKMEAKKNKKKKPTEFKNMLNELEIQNEY